MGGYEFGSDYELMTISADCVHSNPPNECLLEEVGNQARDLGGALAKGLSVKLAAYQTAPDPGPAVAGVGPGPGGAVCDNVSGADYVLRIKDFEGQDLNRLEEAFTSFKCYQHHRVLMSQPGRTEYSYETTADQARLTRNLRIALDYMNLPGSVSVTDGGRTIIVERLLIAPPGGGVIPLPPGTR
jgi:hypothetical protein